MLRLVYSMNDIKFGSLWVGGPLTKIQEISLSSFVFYGHDITLYVYDLSMKVPFGVKVTDARNILPEEDLFLVENSYAGFSDVFRYHMIKKTGLAWVDADTICLSSDWNFKDNIFASLEIGDKPSVVGGVLSLKQDSEIVDYLIESVNSVDKESMLWSELGPDLLDKAFKKFNYMEYAYDWPLLLAIRIHEWEILWDPKMLYKVLNLGNTSKSISVYNQMCTRAGIDKNVLPKGSAMDYFYNKFVI
jgi:hypothetical protein